MMYRPKFVSRFKLCFKKWLRMRHPEIFEEIDSVNFLFSKTFNTRHNKFVFRFKLCFRKWL
jgi:hypothetical protein